MLKIPVGTPISKCDHDKVAEMALGLANSPHGGNGGMIEEALLMEAGSLLDLSASINFAAPDFREDLIASLDSLSRYPNESSSTNLLAKALNVDPNLLVLTNGGAEAISLVCGYIKSAKVSRFDFGLYSRYLADSSGGQMIVSNPNNPSGQLIGDVDDVIVYDEAFYPIATGTWTRRDFETGAFSLGSLTKLSGLPGLRLGFLIAPNHETANSIRRAKTQWSVSGLALAMVPLILERIDLSQVAFETARGRRRLVEILTRAGLVPCRSDANYLFIKDAPRLLHRLLEKGILLRSGGSFGYIDGVRIAVCDEHGLDRLEGSLEEICQRYGAWNV